MQAARRRPRRGVDALIGRTLRWTALLALTVGVASMSATPGGAAQRATGSLLYSQEIAGKARLFTVRPDGTGRRQLTRGASDALNAEWSPDGRSIAFERFVPAEERAAVALMGVEGSRVRELTPTGFQGDPSFTPNGRAIVFTRDPSPSDNGIWIMNTDGSALRRLTRNPFMRAGLCGCDEGAAVSPDAKTVTFVRSRRNSRKRALFAVGIDGKGLRRLTPWHLGPPRHAWSPDGKRIVGTLQAGASANVVTMRRDGSDVRPVTRFTGGRNAYAGSYSPDGAWLAIRIEEGGSYGVYVVRPDGTGLRPIVTSKRAPQTGIDWGGP